MCDLSESLGLTLQIYITSIARAPGATFPRVLTGVLAEAGYNFKILVNNIDDQKN